MTPPVTPPRAGWHTTEFWFSLLVALPGVCVMAGFIPSSDQPNLETLVTKMIAGIAAMISVYKYIAARTEAKKGA